MGKSKNYLNIDNYKYVGFFDDIYLPIASLKLFPSSRAPKT